MKVSIITVCFNSVATIEQTIQSVLNQTYKNIEYIIIDGGSTDGTVDIIKRYEKNIAYWVNEPDRGLYDAMNKGIARASGEVIGIVNSDDWYEQAAVEKVVNCFVSTDAEFVHGDRREIDDECDISYVRVPNFKNDNIYYSFACLHPTVFVRSEVYKKYGVFDCRYKIAADIELMLRFYDKEVKFQYLKETITNFRIGGLSSSRLWRNLREVYQIYLCTLRYSKRVDSNMFLEKVKQFLEKAKKYNLRLFVDRRMARKQYLKSEDVLYRLFSNKNEYIVFGTGYCGIYFYRWCFRQGIEIVAFVDNSARRQKEKIGRIMISDPDMLLSKGKDSMIVIAVEHERDAIEKQLINMGFVYRQDYLFYTDVIDYLRQEYVQNHFPWLCSCLVKID